MPGPQVLTARCAWGMDQASSGSRRYRKTVAGRGAEQRAMQMPETEDGSVPATAGAESQDAAAGGCRVLGRERLGHPSDSQVVRAHGLALGAPGSGRLGPHRTRAVSPSREDSTSLPTVVRIQERGLFCAGGDGPVTLRGHRGWRRRGQDRRDRDQPSMTRGPQLEAGTCCPCPLGGADRRAQESTWRRCTPP